MHWITVDRLVYRRSLNIKLSDTMRDLFRWPRIAGLCLRVRQWSQRRDPAARQAYRSLLCPLVPILACFGRLATKLTAELAG